MPRKMLARLSAVDLLGALPEAALVCSADGTIDYANAPAERLVGCSSEELRRRSLSSLVVGAARAQLEAWLRVGASAPLRVELSRGGGEAAPVEMARLPLDAVDVVVVMLRDITLHKRTEEGWQFLAESSAVLSSSLDYRETLAAVARLAVPQMADWCAVELVPEGRLRGEQLAVAHVDPAKVELARELRRRWPPEPDAPTGVANVIRTRRAELIREITPAVIDAATQDEEQRRVLRALGLRSSIVVPLLVSGRAIGAITFVSAESGRRYDELDLRFAEELARHASLAIENSRLFLEAQDAVRLRDDFLSVASHELRTPLTTLVLLVDTMAREAERAPEGAARERAARRTGLVKEQLRRLSRLIDQLLDVSRITAGGLQLQPEEIDLAELVARVVERFEEPSRRSKSPLSVRTEGDLRGRWDRLRVDTIVTNLVSNAIKYGAGSPVEIQVRGQAEHVELIVTDGGIGIAPEDRHGIFERFERRAPTRQYAGLGIGLWIVRQFAEAHGGSARVESDGPGKGARFVVELPREPPRGGDVPRVADAS